jgi:hypothetical protein
MNAEMDQRKSAKSAGHSKYFVSRRSRRWTQKWISEDRRNLRAIQSIFFPADHADERRNGSAKIGEICWPFKVFCFPQITQMDAEHQTQITKRQSTCYII